MAIEEGLHVFDQVVAETLIDPFDRSDEIRANQKWLLAKDNLKKAVLDDTHGERVSAGGVHEGSSVSGPDAETDVLSVVATVEPRVSDTRGVSEAE